MTLNISFAEISGYVKEHYNQKVTVSKVSDHELCIALEKKIIFHPVSIPLNISLSVPLQDTIYISYNGKMGIELIVAGSLSFLKSRVPELQPYLADIKDQGLTIKLGSIEKLQAPLKYLSLTDIKVAEDALAIVAQLR